MVEVGRDPLTEHEVAQLLGNGRVDLWAPSLTGSRRAQSNRRRLCDVQISTSIHTITGAQGGHTVQY